MRDRESSWRRTIAPALPLLAISALVLLAHAPVFTIVMLLGIAVVILVRRWRA
ncbi:MAG: hypothetical protein ACJ760_07600 [Thermoleophilaceae bacterium]